MRRLDHCNIVSLLYFFYTSGEKKVGAASSCIFTSFNHDALILFADVQWCTYLQLFRDAIIYTCSMIHLLAAVPWCIFYTYSVMHLIIFTCSSMYRCICYYSMMHFLKFNFHLFHDALLCICSVMHLFTTVPWFTDLHHFHDALTCSVP